MVSDGSLQYEFTFRLISEVLCKILNLRNGPLCLLDLATLTAIRVADEIGYTATDQHQ